MPKKIKKAKQTRPVFAQQVALFLTGLLALSSLFALISSRFVDVKSWLSFLAVSAIAAGLFWLAWRVLKVEKPPSWLFWLTPGATLLRLALGAVWFLALPVAGYDTDVQQAGYVMQDAFNRDQAAWDLAQSDEPLVSSFQGASSTDQYGGLLFLSAGVYRFFGGDQHQPLLIIVLTATVSGLAVAFTWAFTRKLWGDKVAIIAAFGVALYPEAALLGSSQMREAFTVFLIPLALYGLLRVRQQLNAGTLALLVAPIVLSIPITWAFTPSLVLMLGLAYLALDEWKLLKSRRLWTVLGAVLVVLVILFFVFYDEQKLWLVQSAEWQAYVSQNASGWIARQFERMPIFAQVPFLVGYGLLRPLLPAALVDPAPPIWTAIGIWRALGWTVLLAMLLYATYLAFREKQWLRVPGPLLLSSWIFSITASYRGGGDLWDSPRYRSAFAAVQIAIAAWAWVQYRETKDPWLRRAAGGALLMIAWFVPWYLRRYTTITWQIVNLDQVIGLGLVSAALFVIWDWLNEAR